MRIEITDRLDGPQLEALAELERQVVTHDGGRLKLAWNLLRTPQPDREPRTEPPPATAPPRPVTARPSGSAAQPPATPHPTSTCAPLVLAWEDDDLLGFLGVYTFGLPTVELAGMVAPVRRRAGIGSALLATALDAATAFEPRQVLLIAPRNGAGGAEFAATHGGRLEHSEHAMVISGSPADPAAPPSPAPPGPPARLQAEPSVARAHTPSPAAISLRAATLDDLGSIRALQADGFGDLFGDSATADLVRTDSRTWLVCAPTEPSPVGVARVTRSGGTDTIYGFVIATPYRGRGIGRQVLTKLIEKAQAAGADHVALEVETTNDHALALYESVGFERVVTEDYYALPLSPPA